MVLEVGWQDCQSSPTSTLHPLLNSQWQGKPSCTLQFTTSQFGCSSSRRDWWFILTHRSFPGFTHAVFLHGFANGSAVFFPHRLIVGSALLLTLTHRLRDCNFFSSVVCRCFLGDLVAHDGLCFPTLLVVAVVVFLTCWGLL